MTVMKKLTLTTLLFTKRFSPYHQLKSKAWKLPPGFKMNNKWLTKWWVKIEADYIKLSTSLSNRVLDVSIAYNEWMESFIEMNSEVDYQVQSPSIAMSDGLSIQWKIKNYSEIFVHRLFYPVVDTQINLVRKFERVLLCIHHFFTTTPHYHVPILEIVNATEPETIKTTTVRPFPNVDTSRRFFNTVNFSGDGFIKLIFCYKNQPKYKQKQPTVKPILVEKLSRNKLWRIFEKFVGGQNYQSSFAPMRLVVSPEMNATAIIRSGFN